MHIIHIVISQLNTQPLLGKSHDKIWEIKVWQRFDLNYSEEIIQMWEDLNEILNFQ